MTPSEIEKVAEHLQAALAILQGEQEEARNPEWYRDTGHLSDRGIEHLYSLFDEGKSIYAAAKAMGMSYRATSLRHDSWKKRRQ